MSANRYPVNSRLRLGVSADGEKSVISDVSFTAPFKITSPFYDERGLMNVMLVSVSAGLMSGDTQEIDITLERGANCRLTSQAFEKIHKMEEGGFARRDANLTVRENARLIYEPLPVIPFRASDFRSRSTVRLSDATSQLFLAEIMSCGRVSMGERFDYRAYRNLTRVFEGDSLIYSDNAVFIPGETDMAGFCMFEGYTHMGSLLIANMEPERDAAEEIRALSRGIRDGVCGVSLTGHGDYCVRSLANGSEPLIELHEKIRRVLDI